MAYSGEISRSNPSCFVFLIDQSGSMGDPQPSSDEGVPMPGTKMKSKAEGVADAVNRLLQNLVIKCAKSEGVRDYYMVSVIGYSQNGAGPAFGGELGGQELVPVSVIAEKPARVEERTREAERDGEVVQMKFRFPVWFDPIASGGTPMCQALSRAESVLSGWVAQHQSAFPPIVINITDGESTDGDPRDAARRIQQLATADGNCLLFNIHVSSTRGRKVEFPSEPNALPDQYARQLFEMSSELPPFMASMARQEGYPAEDGARGFVFNGDLVSVIKFLDIGTRPANMR